MKKTIRYGVIGCGGHAIDAHGRHNNQIPDLHLVALCDPREESMQRYADASGNDGTRYREYGDLLGQPALDAVLILTPDEQHPEQLEAAIDSGIHVMVEKPLAIDRAGLDRVIRSLEKASKNGFVVTSCHPRRFDPPFIWLKELLPIFEFRFGKVVGFRFDFAYGEPHEDWKHWRSLMLDHVGHEIDLVSFLFGRKSFEAELISDDFDRYEVTGKREDFSFSFYGMRRLPERAFHEWATVEFEHGRVVMSTDQGNTIVTDKRTHSWEKIDSPKTDYEARSVGVIRDFTNTINGSVRNYLSKRDLILNNSIGIVLIESGRFSYSE